MTNGEVYDAKQFFDTLNENWPIEFNGQPGVRGGAGSSENTIGVNINKLIIFIGAIGFIEGMMWIRKKNKVKVD